MGNVKEHRGLLGTVNITSTTIVLYPPWMPRRTRLESGSNILMPLNTLIRR